jgi:tRNA(Ile)-lysidine synthase
VSLDPERLLAILHGFETPTLRPTRYLVGLSGGLDSVVLLHALAASRERLDVPLAAVHVDHGLLPDSGRWARHAQRFARSLGTGFELVPATVGTGGGPEAAARAARYEALEAAMRPGDWLIFAHHQDDQAETLLLNLLRGSGPDGLGAMPALRRFGPGWLVRPLLDMPRAALEAYAAEAGLSWNDDPSNRDIAFDRNYLRHEVLPRLKARWPDAAGRLGRSAALQGEAASLLKAMADRTLAEIGAVPGRLPAAGLFSLPAAARGSVLRRAVERAGLSQLPGAALAQILSTMQDPREDANPVVRWPGGECRRYREQLYLLHALPEPAFAGSRLLPGKPVGLGAGFGTLALEISAEGGIDPALAESGLTLETRRGGEQITPAGDTHRRRLKKLLQESGVFPWMREALPLLYAGGELVAVADLWIAAGRAKTPGYAVRWRGAPRYS